MSINEKDRESRIQRCSGQRTPDRAPSADFDSRALPSGPIRMVRLGEVMRMTGLGRTKIYDLQAENEFPMRVQLTEHSVGWVEAEVQAWLKRRIDSSRKRR